MQCFARWYHFNDSQVGATTAGRVIVDSAYMLWYHLKVEDAGDLVFDKITIPSVMASGGQESCPRTPRNKCSSSASSAKKSVLPHKHRTSSSSQHACKSSGFAVPQKEQSKKPVSAVNDSNPTPKLPVDRNVCGKSTTATDSTSAPFSASNANAFSATSTIANDPSTPSPCLKQPDLPPPLPANLQSALM